MDKNNNSDVDQEAMINQSRKSGLTYNEAKAYIAQTTGGRGTHIYSDTDVEAVKQKNAESMANKNNPS
ncbi:hypothetical protein [Lentibacillus saliphilus]|uniref:hypothetical protein n=1 Tax=Lentibacillus saliphilus TaxID=2737028 RepID=UPI001C2F4035|nr:hypothetical protein [Lentibacillus saliphilus]